jgi:protein TonB
VARSWIPLALVAVAACGTARAPGDPGFPVPPPPPPDPVTRSMPAPVLSRYQQPVAPPVTSPPKRESITEPPPGLPLPKVDEERVARQSPAEPRPPLPSDTLPDEVVLRLLDTGRGAFVRCFKKAIEQNPIESSLKVKLHVELEGSGELKRVSSDAASTALDSCLARIVGGLRFPASGKPITVEMPLFYQAN